MPGGRLTRSGSSTSSPPRSEMSSTPDNHDGQSLGARLRRGAHMASNNGVLRRMYSLGGGTHHQRETSSFQSGSLSSSVGSSRQKQQQQHQQQQQQFQRHPSPGSTASAQSSSFVRASPSSDSAASTEGVIGMGAVSSKRNDMAFYSLFARPAGQEPQPRSRGDAAGTAAGVGAGAASSSSAGREVAVSAAVAGAHTNTNNNWVFSDNDSSNNNRRWPASRRGSTAPVGIGR
ncbi:unnamed protein product, partial [Laminaria digitata]